MKTLWIEDEDALNVGRVIVTKTGTKDCVICYSCDESADYEKRLKSDMVATLKELQLEIEECVDGTEGSPQFEQGVDIARCQVVDIIQQKIDVLKED